MQRAELALKLKPMLAEKAHERQVMGGVDKVKQNSAEPKSKNQTRDELARAAGVSHDTISKVEKIVSSPVVELARMTREGAVSINAAAAISKCPTTPSHELSHFRGTVPEP